MNMYDMIPFGFATLVVAIVWWRDRSGSKPKG